MYASEGMRDALNYMRECSVKEGRLYHQYVPYITAETTISEFGAPILDAQNVVVMNDFIDLLKKVVATAVNTRMFNNPLQQLEGERMPLGNFIESVYVNPATPTQFSVDDFIGLLQKYEAKYGVEYYSISSDLQYSVTLTREKIRNAFTSWEQLETLISGYINSLYNGAYLTRFSQTKALVSSALAGNRVQYQIIDDVTDEQSAKDLIRQLRAAYTKFQFPSTEFNAWNKVKGGELALKTWCSPEDIVVLITADIESLIDVEVLARAFNISSTEMLGRVIVVDNFNQYDDDGNLIFDGSHIKCAIMDKAWFKIRTQDFAMDEFYNPKTRCWSYFLNDVRMCNYSLFANSLVFTTEAPTVDATAITAGSDTATVAVGQTIRVPFTLTPPNATTVVTAQPGEDALTDVEVIGNTVAITGESAGTETVTIYAGEAGSAISDTISVTVTA